MSRTHARFVVLAVAIAGGVLAWLATSDFASERSDLASSSSAVDEPVLAANVELARDDAVEEAALDRDATPIGLEREDARRLAPTTARARSGDGTSARLSGSVVLPDGTAGRGAAVLAFAKRRGGLDRKAAALARCDERGRYELAVAKAGDYRVAVALPGLRPATIEWRAERGASEAASTTTLEVGAYVTGTVSSFGTPLARASVCASLGGTATELDLVFGLARFTGGAFEWSRASSESDDRGRYWITGLQPELYELVLGAVRGETHPLARSHETPRLVSATAHAVDFAMDAARLTIVFEREGGYVATDTALDVELVRDPLRERAHVEGDEASFDVLPGLDYELRATSAAYADVATRVEVPPGVRAHRVRVSMPAKPPPAAVHFDLSGRGGDAAGDALISFWSASAELGAKPLFALDFHAGKVRERRVGDRDTELRAWREENGGRTSGYAVAGLKRGRYRARVVIGERDDVEPWRPLSRSFGEVERELDVPSSGDLHVPIELVARGAIALDVYDASGERVAARCTLKSELGDPLTTVIRERARDRRVYQLDARGTSLVHGELCAGDAWLAIDAPGYVSRLLAVHLDAGIVVPVQTTLARSE